MTDINIRTWILSKAISRGNVEKFAEMIGPDDDHRYLSRKAVRKGEFEILVIITSGFLKDKNVYEELLQLSVRHDRLAMTKYILLLGPNDLALAKAMASRMRRHQHYKAIKDVDRR